MALKFRRPRRGRKKTAELAARLAPLEESHAPARPAADNNGAAPAAASYHDGSLVVRSEDAHVPKDLLPEVEERAESRVLGLDPIVLVILLLFLAFIAFIAWQITLMPAPS